MAPPDDGHFGSSGSGSGEQARDSQYGSNSREDTHVDKGNSEMNDERDVVDRAGSGDDATSRRPPGSAGTKRRREDDDQSSAGSTKRSRRDSDTLPDTEGLTEKDTFVEYLRTIKYLSRSHFTPEQKRQLLRLCFQRDVRLSMVFEACETHGDLVTDLSELVDLIYAE